jgi:hypothetical protein
MSVVIKARLKEMILAGLTLPDFVAEFPNLGEGSLNTYASAVRKSLSPEEHALAKKSKSNRCIKTLGWRLSEYHFRIGIKLNLFRINKKMEIVEFCEAYNFGNRNNLSNMENGLHDFSLGEMIRLANVLGIDVEEILKPTPQSAPADVIDGASGRATP